MVKFTSKQQEQVKEFQEAFNHPVSELPKEMSLDRAVSRSIWGLEEIIEYLQASSKNEIEFEQAYMKLLDGADAAYNKSLKDGFPTNSTDRVIAQADALTDQLYFTFGSAVEIGVDIEKIFDIVQAANMSKLFTDENGNKYAKYREEDGKVMKSPEFYSPEPLIKEEIQNQINKALTK